MNPLPSLYCLLVIILLASISRCGCNNYETGQSKGSPTHDSTKIVELPPVKNKGIGNIGNSCYFNSTTQVLASFYRELIAQKAQDPKNKIAVAANELIKSITCPKENSDPAKIKTQAQEFLNSLEKDEANGGVGWKDKHGTQEDASELLTKILDQLNLPKATLKYKLTNLLTNQERFLHSADPFTKLELPLLEDTPQTMQEVVNSFFSPEPMDDCKWEETDNHPTPAKKVPILQDLGKLYNKMLILNLKRYGYDDTGKDFKIDKPIDQPFRITLTQEKSPGTQQTISYELTAFIKHSGGTGGGHYVAYVKVNDTWVEYNDSTAQEVSEDQAKDAAKKGYTFFYQPVK